MARYAWFITKDNVTTDIDDLPSRVGVSGPNGATEAELLLARSIGLRWRTRCDEPLTGPDAVLPCYYGYIWVDGANTFDLLGDEHFGPLDDFASIDAGCVTIEYRNAEGQWIGL